GNAAKYGWTSMLASAAAGVSVMLLVGQLPNAGLTLYAAGIAAGCLLTKLMTEAAMARGYARLRRRLARKLGVEGALVGLAPRDEARLFGGHRFGDAGLLWFEGGLHYRSERTSIELGAADVVEIGLVP